MNDIRISVCMATYNGENFIREQVQSIISQLGPNDEIVVSDDSSTDKTIEILKEFKDSRIILFENQKFKSPIFNFENSLKKVRGEYIFLSDQDDVWLPNKLIEMLDKLESYDLVVSDCSWFGSQAEDNISNFEFRNSGKGVVRNIIKNSYLGNCMAFRKKVLTKALPFPRDIPMHDIWIGLVSDLFFTVLFYKKILSLWRRHENNSTKLINQKSPYSFFQKVKFRLVLTKNLFLLKIKDLMGLK